MLRLRLSIFVPLTMLITYRKLSIAWMRTTWLNSVLVTKIHRHDRGFNRGQKRLSFHVSTTYYIPWRLPRYRGRVHLPAVGGGHSQPDRGFAHSTLPWLSELLEPDCTGRDVGGPGVRLPRHRRENHGQYTFIRRLLRILQLIIQTTEPIYLHKIYIELVLLVIISNILSAREDFKIFYKINNTIYTSNKNE